MMWISLMYEELGPEWTYNNLFRIGASSLLVGECWRRVLSDPRTTSERGLSCATDIERQMEHGTGGGHYGAQHYMAKGGTITLVNV